MAKTDDMGRLVNVRQVRLRQEPHIRYAIIDADRVIAVTVESDRPDAPVSNIVFAGGWSLQIDLPLEEAAKAIGWPDCNSGGG